MGVHGGVGCLRGIRTHADCTENCAQILRTRIRVRHLFNAEVALGFAFGFAVTFCEQINRTRFRSGTYALGILTVVVRKARSLWPADWPRSHGPLHSITLNHTTLITSVGGWQNLCMRSCVARPTGPDKGMQAVVDCALPHQCIPHQRRHQHGGKTSQPCGHTD
jgi:hypothetical protein